MSALTQDNHQRLTALSAFAARFREPGATFGTMAGGDGQSPHWQPSGLAGEFVKMAYDEGWISTGFDWPTWIETDEAEAFITNPPSIAHATMDQLQRLLTAIIRSDRFSEGAILQAYEKGVIAAIAERALTALERDGSVTEDEIAVASRLALAERIAVEAGEMGLAYFSRLGELTVTSKGHQDMVSEADRDLETFLRAEIGKAFPQDAILGEEHGLSAGVTGFTWVLDPIDGTANFVNGIPAWSVVIACVTGTDTVLGVIREPNADETFAARLGHGVTLNGKPIAASRATRLTEGSVGVGLSNRVDWQPAVHFIADLMTDGGMFFRNASGAIMLAYVAAGRLLGYVEQHMNAWDCAAGLLMVREAGGRIHLTASAEMLRDGCMIITGADGVYDAIEEMARAAFIPEAAPGLP